MLTRSSHLSATYPLDGATIPQSMLQKKSPARGGARCGDGLLRPPWGCLPATLIHFGRTNGVCIVGTFSRCSKICVRHRERKKPRRSGVSVPREATLAPLAAGLARVGFRPTPADLMTVDGLGREQTK